MLDFINVSSALANEVYREIPNFNKTILNFFFFSSKNLNLMDFAENGKKKENEKRDSKIKSKKKKRNV